MMCIKRYCIAFILLLLGAFPCCRTGPGNNHRQEAARPNILFIMSDDHARRAISAYDDRLIRTPNIDRIAAEGMRDRLQEIRKNMVILKNWTGNTSDCTGRQTEKNETYTSIQ